MNMSFEVENIIQRCKIPFLDIEHVTNEGILCPYDRYFIQKGLAAQHDQLFSNGSHFGEDILLQLHRRSMSCRALSYLHAQVLHKNDLESLLISGHYPETAKCIRREVIKIIFRTKFVNYARYTRLMRTDHDADTQWEKTKYSDSVQQRLLNQVSLSSPSDQLGMTVVTKILIPFDTLADY